MNKVEKYKVLFVYEEQEEYKIESLWAIKRGDNYEIDNVPFFISNIALGDIVSVEIDEDELYFEELIEGSGNSTIHLVGFNNVSQQDIGSKFEKLGCEWEGNDLRSYISINIPKKNDYSKVKELLEQGVKDGKWDYKEACLSVSHSLDS